MVEATTPTDRGTTPSRLASRVFVVSVAATVLPVIVATGRAIHRGWIPVGDDALFAIRARDVFSYHHIPLLGLVSSASLTAGATLNHPGPLLFDWLALPARLFGASTGVAVGIGLLNVVAVAGIAVFAYRRGGALLGTGAMAVTAGVCWAMGSEALFEPWQPYSMMIPFLCFVVLVWSVACGDLLALPFAAIAASLVFQSHLSYALLVPALAGWAVLALILTVRRIRRETPDAWLDVRRRVLRAASLTGLVLTACWVQPVIDQFSGDGNLGHLLQNASPPKHTVGYDSAARLIASVVALPPWWFRPSIQHTLITSEGWRPPSLLVAVASLAALAAVLAGSAWLAHRREDRVAGRAIVTAAVGLVAGLVTAARIPVTSLGLEAHLYRWLWPLGAFAFFGVAATLVGGIARRPSRAALVACVFAFGAAVLAVLNLPTTATTHTPNSREDAIPVVRALDRQLGVLARKGPILVDPLFEGERLADPYGAAVLAELQRRGIAIVTGDRVLVHQLGSARRFTGSNARSVIFLRAGAEGRAPPPGTPRVAHHAGLTPSKERQLTVLEEQLAPYIRAGGLQLNRAGQAALADGRLPELRKQLSTGVVDPNRLFASREVVRLVHDGDVVLTDPWLQRFQSYVLLQAVSDIYDVSIYLAPRA
jgi:hypothetical protein